MNRQEIRLAVQDRIRDPQGIRTTADEINRYIDDGYGDLAARSGAIVRTATINCPAAEHFVPVPQDCLYPIVLRDLGAGQPVDFVDWPFIDKRDAQWIRRTASYPKVAAMWGLAEMILFEAYSGPGQLEMIYAAIPADLTDSDSPELPLQHHQALIHYCHARVLLKDAHADIAIRRLGAAKAQFKEYNLLAGAVQAWAMDRHGTMQLAIYGDSLRKPQITALPELQSSWRGPVQ